MKDSKRGEADRPAWGQGGTVRLKRKDNSEKSYTRGQLSPGSMADALQADARCASPAHVRGESALDVDQVFIPSRLLFALWGTRCMRLGGGSGHAMLNTPIFVITFGFWVPQAVSDPQSNIFLCKKGPKWLPEGVSAPVKNDFSKSTLS